MARLARRAALLGLALMAAAGALAARKQVILDTDAYSDADDPYAVMLLAMASSPQGIASPPRSIAGLADIRAVVLNHPYGPSATTVEAVLAHHGQWAADVGTRAAGKPGRLSAAERDAARKPADLPWFDPSTPWLKMEDYTTRVSREFGAGRAGRFPHLSEGGFEFRYPDGWASSPPPPPSSSSSSSLFEKLVARGGGGGGGEVDGRKEKRKKTKKPLDAVDLYMRKLREAEDRSITIVSIGYLTNLADVIEHPGGEALIEAKVKEIFIMGGSFPEGWEYNMGGSPDGAAPSVRFVNRLPRSVPVYYLGGSVGFGVRHGRGLILADDPGARAGEDFPNPVQKAYRYYHAHQEEGSRPPGAGDRVVGGNSWDPLTVLWALAHGNDEAGPWLRAEARRIFRIGGEGGRNKILNGDKLKPDDDDDNTTPPQGETEMQDLLLQAGSDSGGPGQKQKQKQKQLYKIGECFAKMNTEGDRAMDCPGANAWERTPGGRQSWLADFADKGAAGDFVERIGMECYAAAQEAWKSGAMHEAMKKTAAAA